jgi:tRNA dimethylallyltransferase
VIAGPTGAGKSSLALDIAAALGGELVNCDSLQLYRGFDVGTAKTPLLERRQIPHRLLDVLDPADGFSAGDYARRARAAIAEIVAAGRLPIVAGGTGFYLRALLDGLPELPSRDPSIRERLQARERNRPRSLHRLLTRLEPDAARRIHSRDVQKTLRALEIRLLTGSRLPRPEPTGRLQGYTILKIGLNPDRTELFTRLNARVESMFSGGLIEEVRGLLAHGATGDEKPFESLGYRQAIEHIRGKITLEQAIVSTQTATRQYAKRQWTWFRRDPEIHWLEGFGDQPEVIRRALELAGELAAKAKSPPVSG